MRPGAVSGVNPREFAPKTRTPGDFSHKPTKKPGRGHPTGNGVRQRRGEKRCGRPTGNRGYRSSPHRGTNYPGSMTPNQTPRVDTNLNVESFNLDHRYVDAPYVRVADRKELPGGDVLIKYDVRFSQPNAEHLPMDAVHSIEHLTAHHMRNHTDALIDFSPMGCQTGFYALTLGVEYDDFLSILRRTFEDLLKAESVPAANEIQCGWGANHSLVAAQRAVADFLNASETWSIVMQEDRPLTTPQETRPGAPGTGSLPGTRHGDTSISDPHQTEASQHDCNNA